MAILVESLRSDRTVKKKVWKKKKVRRNLLIEAVTNVVFMLLWYKKSILDYYKM